MPDNQADRIYAAERKFGYGGWFCDVADAQVYVADLFKSKWWKTRCAISEAHITHGRRKAFPRGCCDCRVTEGISRKATPVPSGRRGSFAAESGPGAAPATDHGPAFV